VVLHQVGWPLALADQAVGPLASADARELACQAVHTLHLEFSHAAPFHTVAVAETVPVKKVAVLVAFAFASAVAVKSYKDSSWASSSVDNLQESVAVAVVAVVAAAGKEHMAFAGWVPHQVTFFVAVLESSPYQDTSLIALLEFVALFVFVACTKSLFGLFACTIQGPTEQAAKVNLHHELSSQPADGTHLQVYAQGIHQWAQCYLALA